MGMIYNGFITDMRKFYPTIKNHTYLHFGLQDGVSSTFCFRKQQKDLISVESIVKSDCSLCSPSGAQLLADPQPLQLRLLHGRHHRLARRPQ